MSCPWADARRMPRLESQALLFLKILLFFAKSLAIEEAEQMAQGLLIA